MQQKLSYLKYLESSLNPQTYKMAVKNIVTSHWIKELNRRSLVLNRVELLSRINLTLYNLNEDEVSYSYLRKYYDVE